MTPNARATEEKRRHSPHSSTCDILVVEDDEVIREELAMLFRDKGYTVATAENGRDALDHLLSERVGVVLLDLMMPVMNGWELASTMRSSTKLATVPVLTITAATNLHSAPPGPIFVKPLNMASLTRAVAVYLGPRSS
jgi:CheY-like chemotaxis protein